MKLSMAGRVFKARTFLPLALAGQQKDLDPTSGWISQYRTQTWIADESRTSAWTDHRYRTLTWIAATRNQGQ